MKIIGSVRKMTVMTHGEKINLQHYLRLALSTMKLPWYKRLYIRIRSNKKRIVAIKELNAVFYIAEYKGGDYMFVIKRDITNDKPKTNHII